MQAKINTFIQRVFNPLHCFCWNTSVVKTLDPKHTASTMPCKGTGSVLFIASRSSARSEPWNRIVIGNPLMKLNQTTPQPRWGIFRRKAKFMRKRPQRINAEQSSQQTGFPDSLLLSQNKTVPKWQQACAFADSMVTITELLAVAFASLIPHYILFSNCDEDVSTKLYTYH